MEFVHEVDGVGLFPGNLCLGPVDFAFVAGVIADADGAEVAFVIAHVGAAAGHRDAVALLLALLGNDVTPFDDARFTVVDDGFVAHAYAGRDIGSQAVTEAVGVPGHFLLRKDFGAPWFVTADDAVVGKGRMDLVRVAVRGVVQGFIVGTHRAGEQTRVTHLVVGGLENGLAVRREPGDEGIVRVHPDFFQQFRCAQIRDHEKGDFLDFSVHHEFEHALEGDATTADGLENRGERRAFRVELCQEAVGESADAVQPFEAVVGGIDRRCLIPEEFLLPEQADDIVTGACAERIDECDIRSVFPDILRHVLIQSFQGTGFADRQVRNGFVRGAACGQEKQRGGEEAEDSNHGQKCLGMLCQM